VAGEEVADDGLLKLFKEHRDAQAAAEAALEYALVSDAISAFPIFSVPLKAITPGDKLPSVDDFRNIKIAYVIGSLASIDASVQLAGTLLLAQRQFGTKIVFAYATHIKEPNAAFLVKLGVRVPDGAPPQHVTSTDDAFDDYLMRFGMAGAEWSAYEVEDWAEVLGTVGYSVVALRSRGEREVIHVVPYYLPRQASGDDFFASLHRAVLSREEATPGRLPDFLTNVRLGTHEEHALEELAAAQAAYDEKVIAVAALRKWRHLIGHASGQPLVELVAAALNAILDGSGYRADQRDETYAEDFWIVGPDKNDFGLVESKGVGGGIRRENVNQLDGHRESNKLPESFPGLLIINSYRNDERLDRRLEEVRPPGVVSLANAQNVVVMRTWDLFQLLGMRLDGNEVASVLIDALSGEGGGWLRVNDGVAEFVRS
jgi:hypothetical protein